MTKLATFCDRFLEASWLLAIAAVPMFFNIYSSRVFEPDKIIMLRSLVLVMLLAQFVKWLEQRPAADDLSRDEPSTQPRVWWRFWPSNPLALPALAVIATFLLGTAASITPDATIWGSYQRLQGTYSVVSYILLFFLMAANLRRKAQIDRLFNVILLVSLPISLYGVAQHQRLDPLPWGGDVITRVTSTMGNAIFLAAYLIMVVPITLYRLIDSISHARRFVSRPGQQAGGDRLLLLTGILLAQLVFFVLFVKGAGQSPNLWWALLPLVGTFVAVSALFSIPKPSYATVVAEVSAYSFLLALQVLTIFLTQSRGPELGLMAGLAFFVLVLAIRRRAKRLLVAATAVSVVAVAFLVVFNLPNSPLAPLRSTPYIGRLGSLLESDGGTGRVRLLIWQGDLNLLANRPPIGLTSSDPLGIARLLVGYGPESMYVAYNKVYPPDLAHYEARNASPDRSHNDILDYLVTVGILGLLAYLFVLAAVAYLLWHHLRRAPDLASQLPLVAIASAIVAHFVESQTGIVIAATRTYFWAYLGIVAAAALLYARTERLPASAPAVALERVAIAAGSVAGGGGAAAKRRAKRRSVADNDAPAGLGRARAGAFVKDPFPVSPYPVLALASVVILLVLVLGRTQPYRSFELPIYLSFGAFLACAVALAVSLGPITAAKPWRDGNWWMYGSASLVVAYLVGANLNVVAADTYYKTGFNLDQARQFEAAVPQYNAALRLAGNQDYYYLFLGRAYLELAKATQRPKVFPAFDPTPDNILDVSSDQLKTLGRDDFLNATAVVLERARFLNPLNTDHYANLARLYRTWASMASDPTKLDLADKYYSQALTLIPQSARLYDEWAQLALERGDTATAFARVQTSAQIDPLYPVTFLLMGDIYQRMGQQPEALDAHAKAVAIDPLALSDTASDQRLAAYEKAGMLPQVEEMYAKSVERNPDLAGTHSALGYVLWRQGKPQEALAEFETAVRLAPTDWMGHRNLALIYESLGQLDQAISSAQSSLRFAPSDQAARLQSFLSDLQKKKR